MRKLRQNSLAQPATTPEPATKPPLDREQLIKAALGLLDKVGLNGLTMRNLADELGIKAGSLYWHVRSKEELLDLLADAVCTGITEPSKEWHWRKRLETIAYEYRRALLVHRDAAQILAGTLPTGENRLRLMESVLSALVAAGFMPQDVVYAAFLVNDYVTQFVLDEGQFISIPKNPDAQMPPSHLALQRFFTSLPAEAYPSIVRLGQDLVNIDMDERFRFGVEILLDGLENRLLKKNHLTNS